MQQKRGYAGLDWFRIAAALLVISIHTSPLASWSDTADFVLTRVVARVAVPFFLMVTGFFVLPKLVGGAPGRRAALLSFLRKTGILYLVSVLLFVPLNLYQGEYTGARGVVLFVRDFLFNGTAYHLWYLPAVLLGVLVLYGLLTKLGWKPVLLICAALYLIGLGGDSYYGFVENVPVVGQAYAALFRVFPYTRNGLFLAPMFLALGGALREREVRSRAVCFGGLAVSFALMTAEALTLRHLGVQRHDSMYVFLLPVMLFLFSSLLLVRRDAGARGRWLRELCLYVYLVHPLCIIGVRGVAKMLHCTDLLVEQSFVHFVLVALLSFAVCWVFLWLRDRACAALRGGDTPLAGREGAPAGALPVPSPRGRAWVEVSLANLRHNYRTLRALLPEDCDILAIAKANAYGCGDARVCRALWEEGVRTFAVATLSEGVALRRQGIGGEILILGYTSPQDLPVVAAYDLSQAIPDVQYAREVQRAGVRVRAHVAIDTGMHRLGERAGSLDALLEIYATGCLDVRGTFSHLCVADCLDEDNDAYTRAQIEAFRQAVEALRAHGVQPGRLHLLNSYGMLNYPQAAWQGARPGITLYGVKSQAGETRLTPALRPVMAVRARVALVRRLETGEDAGYGRNFTAQRPTDTAIVSIGYADGIPRSLSAGEAYVLVRGQRARIIGNVCMDQLTIDVTGIEAVCPGDVVTLIGEDGGQTLAAETLAGYAGTITNELLCRMGPRLPRLYDEEEKREA